MATLLNGTLFSPNSGGDLRSDAHQSQMIGGDEDVDHTQIIGGDTVKLLEDISPPSPPGFGTRASSDIRRQTTFQLLRLIYQMLSFV